MTNKTVLITGAARRIGRAVAVALADAGVNIVIHYNTSRDDAEQTAAAIQAKGARSWLVQTNLSDMDAAQRLVSKAVDEAGPLDFLINNAADFPAARLMDFTPEDAIEALTLNALAPCLIARAFAQQERPGAIVNMLDARMVDYDREHVPYHAAKRMLFSFTRMMALEFAPAIRVNAVAPGLILPPEGKDESYLQELAATNPLNAHGDPADITDAVLFLLRSTFITGQVIFVDGGRHLKGSMYGC